MTGPDSTRPATHRVVTGLRYVRTTVGPGATGFAAAVFVLGALLGAFLTYSSGTARTGSGSPGEVSFWMIFVRNVGVMASMALGTLTLGLVTTGVLMLNGLACGIAVQIYASSGRAAELWTGLAPHFLPEVGAFCLAAGADLRLAGVLVRWIRSGKQPPLGSTARAWLLPQALAVGLLAVAAVIETYVSSVR